MGRERCLLILEGYGVGPRMIRLIRSFWRNAVLVCQASGNYGSPFCAGHGMMQGGPLSAKLFNIFVDAVAIEWLWQLREESELEEAVITKLMAVFLQSFTLTKRIWPCRTRDSSNKRWTSLLNSLHVWALRPT
jgi:hypothetical protein